MQDVAIIGFAQFPHVRCEPLLMDPEMMTGVITEALGQVNLVREEIDFFCSGSTDYLSGLPFSFVHVLDAIAPWPPVYESHVEMDGAWALYEAWLKLQHEEIDTALIYCWGKESTPNNLRTVPTAQLDPYYQSPLGADAVSLAALQARTLLDAGTCSEKDFAEVAVQMRKNAKDNPNAWLKGDFSADEILSGPTIASPLTRGMCAPVSDGCAAMVIAGREAALELCDNPVWIKGIEHRIEPHSLGARDLSQSVSTRLAAEAAGVADGPIDVAEIDAPFASQQLILQEALGLDDKTDINPSGGPLAAHTLMVSGLVRMGEAANRIKDGAAKRALAHATSGPCLQHNLVCVLEAE